MAQEELREKTQNLVFAVNGERFELSSVDPATTLLEFLRTQTRYKGPKLGCGEGGCGACVVLLSKYDPVSGCVEDFTASSCLTLLCSIHFCSVTTTEGLGNTRDGFHSIHQRIAGFHASQCGFCTPGVCMSIFSALADADKTDRAEPTVGFSKLTVSEAEKAIAGNLCRCTGYRSIVDACKSFASDVDLEDLGLNSFWKKGKTSVDVNKLPFYCRDSVCTFPEFLKSEIKASLESSSSVTLHPQISDLNVSEKSNRSISSAVGCWYRPKSIDELHLLLKSEPQGSHVKVKLVAGNTSSGYYKEVEHYDKYIDIRFIPELSEIRRDTTCIEIGAAVTISQAIKVLKQPKGGHESIIFRKIANHMEKVASQFVRNTASIGGNIVMAQKRYFPSDIATILLAVDSSVCIQLNSERLVLSLEEFLKKPPCSSNVLLLSIRIPSWNPVNNKGSAADGSFNNQHLKEPNLFFETYRAAPRPLGNALPYVNAAFLAQISIQETSGEFVVVNLHLAFGAYGTRHAIRARKVEDFLIGKTINNSVMLDAIRLLKGIIEPEEGIAHPIHRKSVAVGLLFDFLQQFSKGSTESMNICQKNLADTVSSAKFQGGCTAISDNKASNCVAIDQPGHDLTILSSKQVVEFDSDYCTIGEPIKKVGVELQASGEAVYVDDIPSPRDCLYGAFIYSTKPMARVKDIKLRPISASDKIISIISVKDIPKGGKNVGSGSLLGEDPLFADSFTECAGQPICLVVAETQKLANAAAKHAEVIYEADSVGPPILTVEEAVKQVGDFDRGMEEADHKILSAEIVLGSQYHFYMETQTALAIPDEDKCMLVYSSTQCPEQAQGVIAECLGVPAHNVRVITRRVGGGFGGKAMRSIPVASACSLAAYKLQRPVRMYLDRKTDMIITGGRHPMKVNYSVGFKDDGKITALHIDLLINAGITQDVSPFMPSNILGALKKYDWGALSFDVKVCKTNHSSKSAMRGPGEVQGNFIAEAVIEHVASTLSIDSDIIRKLNMHTFRSLQLFYEESAGELSEYTLPSVFHNLALSAKFTNRIEEIKHFNSSNKWRKRGISHVPIVHPVIVRATPGKVGILNDGSVVVEVGGIELGQGLWTKVRQMVAYALAQLWDDGSQNLLDKVRVVQADTLSLIQGGYTAGSTTSESSCEAVRLACNVLVNRLRPLKEQLGSFTWDLLIKQAIIRAINLSSSTLYVPDYSSMKYLNYGAAISEVEIDLLTGATTMLRTDLAYDCGQSLNPAVDLGQIEGAFVQGIGFFMLEEYLTNSDGLMISEGTWTYKIPTVDTIPREFNVELLSSGHHKNRVLSSKASGEPPLLLAVSIHCATREAIREARKQLASWSMAEAPSPMFQLDVPATMPVVKRLCGFDNVEKYLEASLRQNGAF
ncbi:hypothetical protein Taro_006978 [Colocasia esculenta]|uniref:Uncharacterized protein n=1 Tax=Colocasia esculenta TaxID=4460 RepID=A0A843TWU1_COLES|nr:hypothetical protein [Colocasia esculenta]